MKVTGDMLRTLAALLETGKVAVIGFSLEVDAVNGRGSQRLSLELEAPYPIEWPSSVTGADKLATARALPAGKRRR